jgi:photosystem II stability/assembly factor-like uncharacterized protein
MKTLLYLFLCTCMWQISSAQNIATSGEERIAQASYRTQLIEESPFQGIQFRSVGPSVMSGRVVDLAVNPLDPTHFFVAYASGGLWETRNNGQSFIPLFDQEAVMTIGAIAVHWPDTSLWIGTGEVNSSRSSYAGIGVYSSKDKGASWEHKGLADSHHIGKVIVHPENPEMIYVASLGPLYTAGGQRGVFRSTDGGATWDQVLENEAGAVDLLMHPEDPDMLYACLWDRGRKAWDFRGNGPESGIYQSVDGGLVWDHITGQGSGFPQGEGVGRIGISMAIKDGRSYLYAVHDNQDRRPKVSSEEEEGMKRSSFKEMQVEEFLSLDAEEVDDFLKENGFPEEYDFWRLSEEMRSGTLKPVALYDYLDDANTSLFDTPVIGAEVYRLSDESPQWTKTHDGYLDDLVYSYGYYFGMITAQANDPDRLYIGGVPLLFSSDGGQNWQSINPPNVHADHHVLWVDPDRQGHLISGNDGGINISYDNGQHFSNCNSPAVGQFYTVQVDDAEPYNIYGGLQDNGVWEGPSNYEASEEWHQTGHYPYEMLLGGDGMQIEVDPRDNETVYTGYQFGHYYRLSEGEKPHYFHPSHDLGEKPLRWNWQTPILLSEHHPDILYMCSNKVHRSMDRGEKWEAISDDLSNGPVEGNVPYGTITCIDESKSDFGQLIVGTDDGNLWHNFSGRWSKVPVEEMMPDAKARWVSRVIISDHEPDPLCYAAFNGYRNDDMNSYLYRSDAGGSSWQRIGLDLPKEPINVVLEDPIDPDILYVGTDHGLYVSLDKGEHFSALMNGLPQVPVHDLVIQAREDDLVVGTHGRSIYVANIGALREVKELDEAVYLFPIDTLQGSESWGSKAWSQWFGYVEAEVDLYFYSAERCSSNLKVLSPKGLVLHEVNIPDGIGLQQVSYDLSIDQESIPRYSKEFKKDGVPPSKRDDGRYYLGKGSYQVIIRCGEQEAKRTLIIE